MLKKLMMGATYDGRIEDRVPIGLSLDRETAELLNVLVPSKKGRSAYVTKLVHAEAARREERARIRKALIVDGEEDSSL